MLFLRVLVCITAVAGMPLARMISDTRPGPGETRRDVQDLPYCGDGIEFAVGTPSDNGGFFPDGMYSPICTWDQ